MPRRDGRSQYTGRACAVAGLCMAGCHATGSPWPERNSIHRHDAVWELYHITGSFYDWLIDGQHQIIPPRSWLLVPPGMSHGERGAALAPGRLHWFHFDRHPAALLSDDQRDHTRLAQRFTAAAGTIIAAASTAEPLLDAVIAGLAGGDDGLRTIRVQTALRQVLLAWLDDAGGRRPAALDPLRRVAATIDSDPADDWTVDQLARRHGVNPSTFTDAFAAVIGLTPVAYRSCRRVIAAKQLLETGTSPIATIATRLGYATAQHFATVFARHTGLSPSAWRRRFQGGD